jgi:signal transduction histidine kinase
MNYYAFTSFFNGIVVLAISSYLFSCQRKNALYQSCGFFSMTVGLWCVFYAIWQIQVARVEALIYIRLAMISCYAIPFAFLWLVLKMTHRQPSLWTKVFLLGSLAAFMILGFTPLMIKDVAPVSGFDFWPRPGPLMNFFVPIFFILILIAYGLMWKGYIVADKAQRWQIKWVSLSILPGWIGGATNWCLWYDIPIPPVAHIFVGVSFLFLFYAIARSRLFDLEAITDLVQEAKLSALGIMATSINHEVRNPLFVIKGLAETLVEKPNTEPEKIKDIARRAVAQAERALEIIRNFSAYAKRQSSKTFEKQSLDIREVLESIEPLVCSELALDHIQLQMNIPPKTLVCADRHSLEEIFINLIVNACQAINDAACLSGDRGGGEIEISAKEEKSWISIIVRDTGPGLSVEQLSRIFEPFYTTKASGTGLGLYVVRQLVEKNSGQVEVSSRVGFGTTFTIFLNRNR